MPATVCAAGLENLRILRDEELLTRAEPIGAVLGAGFGTLVEEGLLSAVRGRSGIWAVDVPDDVDAFVVRDAMMARGVLPRPVDPRTLAFCPPQVISDADLAARVEALDEALREGRGSS